MGNFMILTKVLFKNTGSPFQLKRGKGKVTAVLLAICLAFAFGSIMLMLYEAFDGMFNVLSQVGQAHLLAESLLNGISFVVFFFALLSTPSIFYFSQDVENLLPLPLKPEEIITAKFIVSLVYEYFVAFLLMAPLYAVLIQHTNPFLFAVNGVIVFLLAPVLPLLYATVLVMVIMSFSRFSKNKDRFNMIAGILSVCIGLGVNLAVQKSARFDSAELARLLTGNQNPLSPLSLFFPTNTFYANALTFGNTLLLLAGLAILAIGFVLFLLAARQFYFKGVLDVGDSSRASKKMTAEGFARQTKSRNVFLSCVWKELLLLVKNPVTFINCISTAVILPFIFVIITVSSPELIEQAAKLSWDNPRIVAVFFVICGSAGIMTGMLNSIAPTAITREGKNSFFMKYIPISYRLQIHAKAFTGILVGTVAFMLLLTTACVIVGIPPVLLVPGLALALVGSTMINYLGLLLDLAHPNLNWENEQQAVKQSLNVLLVMVAGFIILTLFCVAGFILLKEPVTAWLISFLVLSAGALTACQITANMANRLMERI